MSANSRKVSPLAWVPTVYFAMGLPFIIVNMVATLMFRGLGIDDARITLWTSLIILPWSLKPFWSPLMEMFRTKKFWVVATQLVSGLGLALVALSLPLPNFFPYAIALMAVVAFSGATHDIATDGVYITELSKDLQAKFIGWQGAFYNIAKVFAMGGLVYLAGALKDHVGIVQAWMTVMGLCGGILFLLGLYHIRMLPSGGAATAHADSFGGAMRETKRIFLEFFKKKYIWIYFAFILFYRFAEGLVIKIVPLFLNAPLDQQGMVVDLNDYLTESEKSEYIEGYLTEGDFDDNGTIKIFPVAKSTELMFLNETDWEKFAQATGAAYDDLSTVEGLVATAGAYYDWTDAQTPEPDDGKALFGRDAMANYMLVGARQLGDTLFEVQDGKMTLNFDKDVARKLWDNYYVPFVKGWFAAIGRFRSDDIKVGNVLAYVGSSSSATFFPAQVMVNDTESYDIDMTVLPSPKFAGGEDVAVQQGAGMVVTAGTEEEINASVEFLKWFTQPEHNISFSVDSGYLPVTTAANDMEAIKTSGLELSPKMERILSNAVQSVKNNTLYTPSAFAGGNKARKVLEYSLSDLASADRATVQERVAAGQPAADAEAEFLTDEYFDAWYGGICTALEEYAG